MSSILGSGAFWVTTLGQVSADWCLYLLIFAMPLYLHDVSYVSLHSYLVSLASFGYSFKFILSRFLKSFVNVKSLIFKRLTLR